MRTYLLARLVSVCFAGLLLFTAVGFGQSDRGVITGYIRDQSGATVPNATVIARNENNGTETRTTTNGEGSYTITNILPATYTITAEAPGFKKYESKNNKLDASARIAVDGVLAVGSATETVEVTSTAPMLQSESAATQKTVTREQISALELNGRNPIFMAQLVPGTRGSTLANLNSGMSQGPSQINGARTQDSLITLDGAPAVRTRSNGLSIGAADVDSTQEIQVLTSSYSAEYGRAAGGQIRIVTKAGGSDFHGAAYEYIRNNIFNANTWARNTNPITNFVLPFHYNQYGYNVGGPFFIPGHFNKDRSRFFWYYGNEWLKWHYNDTSSTPGNPGLLTVPTALMRQGNFSELLNPSNIFYGKSVTIKNPTTGAVYPGNVIPANQLSPNGLGLLKAYPAANLTTPIGGNGNWYATGLHTVDQRKDQLNADMVLTNNQRLAFRRNNYVYNEYIPFDGNSDRVPRIFSRPNQSNSLNYVWSVRPTLVNEAIVSVSLDANYIGLDLPKVFNRADAGLNYPYLFPTGKLVPYRIPTIALANFSTLNGGPYPSQSSGMIYTAADSLTWIKGAHTIKFGGYFERSGENDNDEINVNQVPGGTNNQNGSFQFTDNRQGAPTTGVAVANAALGLFDTYSELGQRAYTPFRGSMTEFFVQDSWKATDKLHIDYGVRYTVIIPYSSLWRNMIVFDPSLYDPTKAVQVSQATGFVVPGAGDRYNGMVIPGSGWPDAAIGRVPEATSGTYNYLFRGITNHYSDVRQGQIQPRLGLAYQITPKTVLRAGGGRFFSRVGVSDSVFLGGNPPFQPTASVIAGSADNPGGASATNYPLTVTTQSKAFKNPEAWNWNFTVERELPGNSVVSVAYVGRRGLHQQRESDINQPTIAAVIAARLVNPKAALDSIRPYQGYGTIRETDNVASSLYNSFQLAWNRRMSRGFLFGFAYTLAKSMDNGSNQRDVIPNTYDAHNLWGPSEFDNRHTLVANFLYEIPLRPSNALLKQAIAGWQISAVAQFQTGTPCGVLGANDYAGVGLDTNLGCGVTQGQFYNVNGTPYVTGQFAANGSNDPHYWFNTQNPDGSNIFNPPAANTFSTQRVRNIIYQPGFQNWNAGLFKAFPIKERIGFQFRAEAFNVFNHPNWGGASGGGVGFNPNNSSTFGKVTSKGSERNMQLSLRFYF